MRFGLWLASLALAASGCGASGPEATVSGKVSYDGKPLDKGTVMFTPRAGVTANGRIAPDGTFKLLAPKEEENISPGEYSVVIITDTSSMAQMSEDPMALGAIKPTIPLEFSSSATTPLKYEVKAGANMFDIVLDEHVSGKK